MSAIMMPAAAPCAAPDSEQPADQYVTLAAASRMSGLHETTVLRMALAGDVRYRTRGRRVVFSAEDIRSAS